MFIFLKNLLFFIYYYWCNFNLYYFFFKDEGWNNVEMVYDGKVLIVRIRFVLFDGIGVEEKDIKILLGIEKNINIFLIIRYGKK